MSNIMHDSRVASILFSLTTVMKIMKVYNINLSTCRTRYRYYIDPINYEIIENVSVYSLRQDSFIFYHFYNHLFNIFNILIHLIYNSNTGHRVHYNVIFYKNN